MRFSEGFKIVTLNGHAFSIKHFSHRGNEVDTVLRGFRAQFCIFENIESGAIEPTYKIRQMLFLRLEKMRNLALFLVQPFLKF